MHHYLHVSFFGVAALRVRHHSRTPVLVICASFQASLSGSSGAGTAESGGMTGHCLPCLFKSGATGGKVPFRNRIIGNFMV